MKRQSLRRGESEKPKLSFEVEQRLRLMGLSLNDLVAIAEQLSVAQDLMRQLRGVCVEAVNQNVALSPATLLQWVDANFIEPRNIHHGI